MLKKRNHGTQIAIALIIIMLCIVSLSSVTFALFTNGEDGKIGVNVTSGKISIDIVDAGDGRSLKGETLSFVGTDGGAVIVLGPGSLFRTEPFKIKNDGDIPINFIVYVKKEAYVDEKYLEALEFYIIEYSKLENKDLETVIDDPALTDAQSFEGSVPAKSLGESYCLVIRMKKDASNEVMNKKLVGVGITVFAVQGNVDASDALDSQPNDTTATETVTEPAETTVATEPAETVTEAPATEAAETEATETETTGAETNATETTVEAYATEIPDTEDPDT